MGQTEFAFEDAPAVQAKAPPQAPKAPSARRAPNLVLWLIELADGGITHAVEQAKKYPEWNELVDLWCERKRELEGELKA